MKFISDQFRPSLFSFWSEVVWQGEICQLISPQVLLLGLISEIKSSYLTWQNSPKLCKHVGGFLLFLFSFLRVYFLKKPIQESTLLTKTQTEEVKSVNPSKVIFYSLDNIFNFTSSFSESSSISKRQFSSTASEIWSYRNLLSALLYYLTTPRLITDCRKANGLKVFKRKYEVKAKIYSQFYFYFSFYIMLIVN